MSKERKDEIQKQLTQIINRLFLLQMKDTWTKDDLDRHRELSIQKTELENKLRLEDQHTQE